MSKFPWQDEYAWKEVFGYADFSISYVVEVYQMEEGDNDGPSWIMWGLLEDGQSFFLSAGCDYTGWDCQAGGNSYVSASNDRLVATAMTIEDRRRFGLPSVGDRDL